MADGGWEGLTRRIISFFQSQEVKTPLSFMFRVVLAFVAALGLILYAPGLTASEKVTLVEFASGILILLCIFVGLFAWFRPRNLVYGESGHRAERRMEYGTERQVRTAAEVDALRPMRNRPPLEP